MSLEPAVAPCSRGLCCARTTWSAYDKGTVEMQWREMGREWELIGMFLLATIVAAASVRSTFAQTEMVTVNIPPQELSTALTALAEQAQPTSALCVGTGEWAQIESLGTVKPQDTVRQLLEGTGLKFTFTDAKTVTLQSAPSGRSRGRRSADHGGRG